MNSDKPTIPRVPGTVPDPMFPALSPAQQARVAAHGQVRKVAAGEVLVEANTQVNKFFVVSTGQLNILKLFSAREELMAVVGPHMFTGELNTLSGRRALVRIRAAEASELIEIDRD